MTKLDKPVGIVVHHSLSDDGVEREDFDSIKRYHIKEKGWDDIGYHFLVEYKNGKVVTTQGRPINIRGAHTEGHNDMIGICVTGNFDKAPCPADKLNELALLCCSLMKIYNLKITDIHKHHEYHPKSCPGTQFQWDELIAQIGYKQYYFPKGLVGESK